MWDVSFNDGEIKILQQISESISRQIEFPNGLTPLNITGQWDCWAQSWTYREDGHGTAVIEIGSDTAHGFYEIPF